MKTKTPKIRRFVIVALLGSILSSLLIAGCNNREDAVPEGAGKDRFKNDPGLKGRPEGGNAAGGGAGNAAGGGAGNAAGGGAGNAAK